VAQGAANGLVFPVFSPGVGWRSDCTGRWRARGLGPCANVNDHDPESDKMINPARLNATFRRHGRSAVGVALGLLVGLGCGRARDDATSPNHTAHAQADPIDATRVSALILDKTNSPGPASGFYWIPPVVTAAAAFTSLDTTGASNGLTVRIDRLYQDNATDPTAKATFTGSGITMVTGSSSSSFPGVAGPFYGVNWTPGSGVAAGETYRVSVQALTPSRRLGVVDVQVVANASAAAAVDRTRFTPLIVGSTLPIVFRLESKDSDGDAVNDWRDNCTVTKNASQLDSDADGRGDACQCLNVPNGTSCSTGCRTGQTCTSGTCGGGTSVANGTACSTGNLCKQSETCTSGTCGGGSNRSTGTACTTGNPCRQSETCTSGTCGGGSNRSTGTACATGNPCKQSETCTSGTCGGGSNRSTGTACSTTGNPCTSGQTCSSSGTCTGTASNKPNGTLCSDTNLCTPDTCQTGVCTPGTAVSCSTDTQCHSAGTCNKATGLCPAIKANATACNDGNACTQTDVCQGGACTGSGGVAVDDNNPCTTDSCSAGSGVVHTPVADWTLCSDGNICDGLETCRAGVCTEEEPGAATTCAPGTQITFYQSFDSETTTVEISANGQVTPNKDNYTAPLISVPGLFGAGIASETEAWIGYQSMAHTSTPSVTFSKPGSASIWIKLLPGHSGSAFLMALDETGYLGAGEGNLGDGHVMWATLGSVAGVHTDPRSVITPVPATWRPDGEWHLVVVNWSLYGLTMVIDGVPSEVSQPAALPAPATFPHGGWVIAGGSGTGMIRDEVMYLNRPLTMDEIAWYYAQRHHDPSVTVNPARQRFSADPTSCNLADDLNPCTADFCDPILGAQHTPLSDVACNDGNACTQTDICVAGVCTGSGGIPVDDGNPCTADSCAAASGAVHTPVADWTPCPDSDVCDGLETCQAGTCTNETPGAATTCSATTRVTFYQSFNDDDLVADIGLSQNTATGTPMLLGAGVFGAALNQSVTNALVYSTSSAAANPGNLVLSKPGSVSMWVNPNGQPSAGAVYLLAYSGPSKLFVFDYGSPQGVGAVLERGDGALGRVSVFSNGPPNWRNEDRWHLVVVNWSQHGVTISVDGVWSPVASAPWMQTFDSWPGGAGSIYPGPYWDGAGGGILKDELLVLNRPMTRDDVQWYYAQRDRGGTVNPAIAYFDNTAGRCDVADDFNPCTDDRCDATSGITHPPAPGGTTCTDDNACTTGDACNAGLCSGGNAVTCPGANACNTVGACVPSIGCPAPVAANEGAVCDDSNANTSTDKCVTGMCRGTAPTLPESTSYGQLVDIGVLDGAADTRAAGINTAGDVTGTQSAAAKNKAWRYTGATGTLAPIPVASGDAAYGGWRAMAIGASGVVVGSTDSPGEGFRAAPGGTAEIVTDGHGAASATGINDAGQIAVNVPAYVGGADQGYLSGGRRDPDGTKQVVARLQGAPTLGGGTFNGDSAALGIAPEATDLVGYAGMNEASRTFDAGTFTFQPGGSLREAYRFTDPYAGAGDWHNLNDYGAASGWQLLYEATATNGAYIVGWGARNNRCHAFRYNVATNEVVDLDAQGRLGLTHPNADLCGYRDPDHFYHHVATAINRSNEVVGNVAFGGAFYFSDATGAIDLQDLVDPALHVTIETAEAINDNHEIVGSMTVAGDPKSRAYKLKLPEGIRPSIELRLDGIVDMSDSGTGPYVALFGYDNQGTATYRATSSTETLDGHPVVSPNPAPPELFPPGNHVAIFRPTFAANQTVVWQVDGQPVSASATSATPLTHLPVGPAGSGGFAVVVPGTSQPVVIRTPAITAPSDPIAVTPPVSGRPFNGAIAGTLSATPSGAAIYTVPISTPPGVGGMAPDLRLVYSSQSGDGIAGQGWSMTGLSTIYRCPKTRERDGVARPITVTSLDNATNPEDVDGICIDGDRLWETPAGSGVYQREQKDFSTIRRQSDGSFVVQTKTGEVHHYGSRANARVQRPGVTIPLPGVPPLTIPAETVAWLLDRVVDARGNYYDLHYNGDNSDFRANGITVTAINYTGNLVAGTPTFAEVSFGYEARTDIRTTRFGAFTIPRSRRLKTITTPVGTYTLTYATENPTLASRLTQIIYCAPAGTTAVCTEPMRFNWTWGELGWKSADHYNIPDQINPLSPQGEGFVSSGTQLIDLDADGRPDFVRYRWGKTPASWYNDGVGFVSRSEWNLPKPLITPSGTVGAVFADVDGDGFSDLVVASDGYQTDCSVSNWFFDDQYCQWQPTGASPVVYFNRLQAGQGWVRSDAYGRPAGWAPIDFSSGDHMADVDGDGRSDLVRLRGSKLEILQGSDGTSWVQMSQNLHSSILNWPGIPDYSWSTTLQNAADYHLEDINRDGLADIVSSKTRTVNGALVYDVLLNMTLGKGDAYTTYYTPGDPNNPVATTVFSMWKSGTFPSVTGHEHDPLQYNNHSGDIDGDGLLDTFVNTPNFQTRLDDGRIDFSIGTGYDVNGGNSYLDPLRLLPMRSGGWGIGGALVDLNSDGLADWVHTADASSRGWTWGGRPFINTGTTWQDLSGPANDTSNSAGDRPVPVVPLNDRRYGLAYVDLNGDGVTDAVQAWHSPTNEYFFHAWLNTFRPPVIIGFPDGVAAASTVGYEIISTAAAKASGLYSDSGTLAPKTKHLILPMRVVASISRDSGAGSTLTTRYKYTDLRDSVDGQGSQGFATVKVTDPLARTVLTTYAQVRPYTGLPLVVATDNHGPMSVTENTYCDDTWPDTVTTRHCQLLGGTLQPLQPTFVHPTSTTTTTNLRTSTVPESTGPATIKVTSTFDLDEFGNPEVTVVTTEGLGESRRITTTNHYGGPSSTTRRLGKAVDTTRKAEIVLPANQASSVLHTTAFEYQELSNHDSGILAAALTNLALVKTKAEPGSGDGTELHVALEYDEFGNVTRTTSCATHFDECAAGAAGPSNLPFRTTKTSYTPSDFNPAPAGVQGTVSSLTYARGRFPVKSTNAEGHVSYSAFNPTSGALVQMTGPNGVHTCYAYDLLGRRFGEVERCKSSSPLSTLVFHNFVGPGDVSSRSDRAVLVSTTVRPDGTATWAYTDAQGRPVTSVTNGFDGNFVQVDTHYDSFGRVDRVTKPRRPADAAYATTTRYDELGRPWQVTSELGPLVLGGPEQQSVATVDYGGATTRTTTTSAAGARTQSETKNVLGKMARTVDAAGKITSYSYDPDGNLSFTTDPAGNVFYRHYDRLGRKDRESDPDLGAWSYQYSGYGDLVGQIDALGRGTTMTYDRLGRMVGRSDGSGSSQWIYDVAPGAGVGKLAAMIGPSDNRLAGSCGMVPFIPPTEDKRSGRWFEYTALGQLKESFECVDGDVFQTTQEYDSAGRKSLVRYPSAADARFAVRYHYTSLGYLQYVADDTDGGVYWKAEAMNALGQVIDEQTRNGVETVNDRSPGTGWLLGTTSTAHADNETLVQRWAYSFDRVGNLTARERSATTEDPGYGELFTYDALDRLATTTINGAGSGTASRAYLYDALGNITEKGGAVYSYTGCGGRPHAVCRVGSGATFTYDSLGNLTDDGQRHLDYDAANKVTKISSHASPSQGDDNGTVDIVYGAERDRVVQNVTRGSTTRSARTVYVGLDPTGKSLYERTTRGSEVEHVHFIYAGPAHGGGAFAVRVVTKAGSATPTVATRYHHFDHLGSITATSDEIGHVVGSALGGSGATIMGYDAWGGRRNPDGSAAPPASFAVPLDRRGFTGHETIPTAGLVNMNGRMYDPVLGRFLSPDPVIQAPDNLQSYNHYSYVLNNPLRYTDPTGYRYFNATPYQLTQLGIGAGAAIACPFTGGATCGIAASALSTALAAGAVYHAGGDFGAVYGTILTGIATGMVSYGLGVIVAPDSLGGAILLGGSESLVISAFSAANSGEVNRLDILTSVTQSVLFTAISGAMPVPSAVSKAQTKAAGGGSEAVEGMPAETVESVIAAADGHRQIADAEWYVATGANGDRMVAEATAWDFRIRAGIGAGFGPVQGFTGISIDNSGDVSFFTETTARVSPTRAPAFRFRFKIFDIQNQANIPGFTRTDNVKLSYGPFSFSGSDPYHMRGSVEFPGGIEATGQLAGNGVGQVKGETDVSLFNVTTPFRKAGNWVTGVIAQPMLDYFRVPR
jgi:RHS repeat-associated protein